MAKTLGGSSEDIANSIKQTSDMGYIVAGRTFSNDGDVLGNNGNVDYWIVKLSSSGVLEWQKALGGNAADIANNVHQTSDGGYIVAGSAGSLNTGDVTGHNALGSFNFWVVKLSSTGELIWQKAMGGSGPDRCQSITPTSDGMYVAIGDTESTNGDVLDNDGGADIWAVKLNAAGEIVWQKTLGGTQAEVGFYIQQTSDKGYILTGYAWSNNGDVSGVHGYNDFWVVKLAPETIGLVEAPTTQGTLEIFPNPATQSISLKTASEEPTLSVTVSDLLGRAILQQNIQNGGSLDVSTLVSGSYLVLATAPSGRAFSGKLQKE